MGWGSSSSGVLVTSNMSEHSLLDEQEIFKVVGRNAALCFDEEKTTSSAPSSLFEPTPFHSSPLQPFRISSSRSLGSYMLKPTEAGEGIKVPHKHDVLCGRGGAVNNHAGNVCYRRVVESNKPVYHTCKLSQRLLLSRSIVEAIAGQKPAGRFLAFDKKTKLWYDIGTMAAIRKTSQALREVKRNASTGESKAAAKEASKSFHKREEEDERARREQQEQQQSDAYEDSSVSVAGTPTQIDEEDEIDMFEAEFEQQHHILDIFDLGGHNHAEV